MQCPASTEGSRRRVGDENTNVSIDVDGETIDKVNSFTYRGSIMTSTGSCSEDIKARMTKAKNATMELDTIWKDRGIRKELKMKLVKALIWLVITYGAGIRNQESGKLYWAQWPVTLNIHSTECM